MTHPTNGAGANARPPLHTYDAFPGLIAALTSTAGMFAQTPLDDMLLVCEKIAVAGIYRTHQGDTMPMPPEAVERSRRLIMAAVAFRDAARDALNAPIIVPE